ncbi:MAG: Trk system potassium transporter TrkA [Prolixibacteraceae bacterium]|jgi:trk system potassium uptake protein TrkA|nr:Trk system potassium transporter TrkA [Prolixibacteraceae bacterium]
MKVVIAGAGEVGTHLARMLSEEDHEIVLMDDDNDKLQLIANQVDLLTVNGAANSIADLKEAGIAKADLFIAVTPYESRNVLACILAKDLGVKKTLARINNAEYIRKVNKPKFVELGVDELIYPESLAAKEIVASVKQPGARVTHEFSGGKLMLYGIKIRDNATEIVDKTLADIAKVSDGFRAVAITRNDNTIIPKGKDKILAGDIVYFVTTRDAIHDLYDKAGKTFFEVKNIMFLGGSRIAQRAIEKLEDQFNVKVIEQNKERCQQIADRFSNVLVINGDGRNLDLLKEEGIDKMDAFVAVTGNSETNILTCQLAKKMGVKRSVAEIENIDFISLAEQIGIGSVINKKFIAASFIYRFSMHSEISSIKCLTATEAEAVEVIAHEGSKATTRLVKQLGFPDNGKIGGIIRGDQSFIVTGETQIQAGDRVVVFALPAAIKKIDKFFK